MEVRTCPHRVGACAEWVNNDGKNPPVILVGGMHQTSVLSLTNQVIRVSCTFCFQKIRQSLSISTPGTDT